MGYGTGAIMAVPAHDQRDFEFAKKFDLPIKVVVQPIDRTLSAETMKQAYAGEGAIVNSEALNGVPAGKGAGESVEAAVNWLEANGKGSRQSHLSLAGLADFATALLGLSDSSRPLRHLWHRSCARCRIAREAAGRNRVFWARGIAVGKARLLD